MNKATLGSDPSGQGSGAKEAIIDHQIHSGSHEYSIMLTDQGNIHLYHIYDK